MPELRAQLQSGQCGASWVPPEGAEVVQDDKSLLILRDPTAKVVWHVTSSPFPFALDAAHDDVLRADLELSARDAFDKAWTPPAEDELSAPRRTEDSTWSPVIEHGRLELSGGTALRLLRRIAYQPGKEIVAGHLIVPTASGHLDFCALARASVTGIRETVVMATRSKDRASAPAIAAPGAEVPAAADDDEDGEAGEPFPPQAAYDDPGLDALFPEHPLTVVRQAVGRLGDALKITRAAPHLAEVIQLEEPRCAFAAPPRYVPVPMEVIRMHPTLRILMRSGVESWRRNLEVWRLEDVQLRRRDPRDELCALARDTVAGWSREGATDIQATVEAVEDFGDRPQAQQSVSLMAGGAESRSIFRWWVEPDGIVYRLGSGGPPAIPDEEHMSLLDGVQASWRRLDAVKSPLRPWWRIWR